MGEIARPQFAGNEAQILTLTIQSQEKRGAGSRDSVSRTETVNGGGIMHHAERSDGPVAAAQKCATHGPLSVATNQQEMYGVELYAAVRLAVVDEGLSHHEAGRRFRHRPSHGEEDAELLGASRDTAGSKRASVRPKLDGFTGIVRRFDPGGGHGSGRAAQAAPHGRIGSSSGCWDEHMVQRRLYHREGLCSVPGGNRPLCRGLRSTASPAGPCPGRLRRGGAVELRGQRDRRLPSSER